MAITTPKTRTYYGEYTLKHWIDLILSGNIVLPDYQRSFAWSEEKVQRFILSLRKGDYVPPVIIAAAQENGASANLILDGQQRLTSVLLAALGCMPNRDKWQDGKPLMDENVQEEDGDEQASDQQVELEDSTVAWSFRTMLGDKLYATREDLKKDLSTSDYKELKLPEDFALEELLVTRHLGFLYIVPAGNSADAQMIFTKLFYSINYEGVRLSKQESRKALYYQDSKMTNFFEGYLDNKEDVLPGLYIAKGAVGKEKIDWLRYLSILSQKSLGQEVLTGYRREVSREDFYKDYVSYMLGLEQQKNPEKFEGVKDKEYYKDEAWKTRYEVLHKEAEKLKEWMGNFTSIIDADYWLFGLIFSVVFENKTLKEDSLEKLAEELHNLGNRAKRDEKHRSRPNQLTHLRRRINDSIRIYNKYVS
jgi:hypothetical protein